MVTAIDEDAMQRLLAAIAQQQQAGQQQVLNLQNQQAQFLHSLQQNILHPVVQPAAVTGESKIIHIRDLPQFSGHSYEDPVDFLLRFETVGQVHNWQNSDKLKHFALALKKNEF